ncbi:efflux RND transporter periplasmic adaptor subunit [Roseateles violae]|uniref:Efflux RND transporter periplasmic adaptor subunit n=1 Tax=Roseateles violae TaxID=3058042 RepID=A0ABT8DZW7_9BURK|nr:efflux RND transporter periplasmic adaptor subunit [Pelomonas sp. PFR6]MDN3923098.1 efflux RND transporter periplasmic adaptor subunit [Pelomonas sp. PFR6]
MKKKLHTVVAIVAIASLSGLAYWWQHQRPAADAAGKPATDRPAGGGGGAAAGGPVPVEAGKVELINLADDAQAVGTLRARQAVLLKPEVSGRITKLGFADGQRVRRGQLLVQLDDSLQAAQLQQAEAQAGIARTQLKRSRELLAQGFVSASAVDQAVAALEVAEAQVALNRAQLERMRVLAPFDGVMGIRSVNLGDYVKDGADLVSIEDASTMWVDFRLPERYVPRLKIGQEVELGLDALPGRSFSARIEALDTQLEANGRSLLVRARVQGASNELRSGLFARVRVVFAQRAHALVVPEEALVPQGGKQYVIKLVEGEGGKPPTAQRIEAKLGARIAGKVELLAGVKAGERVVTAGQAKLMRGEGQALKVVDVERPAMPTAPAAATAAASSPVAAR